MGRIGICRDGGAFIEGDKSVKTSAGLSPSVIQQALHYRPLVLYRPEKCGCGEGSAQDAVFSEAGSF